MKILLTIIIPTFNSEIYIEKLLLFLLKDKTIKKEIIVIDDASTDSTKDIVLKYKEIILISNKKNRGVSNCRNQGIKKASGTYLSFIDSDDFVSKNYFTEIKNNISNKFDLLIYGTKLIYSDKSKYIKLPNKKEISKIDLLNSQNLLLDISIGQWVTNKVFKSSVIKHNNIIFDEKLTTGEDLNFMLRYLLKCKKIKIINKYLYYYNRNNINSLTRQNICLLPERVHKNNQLIKKIYIENKLPIEYFYEYEKNMYIYIFKNIYKQNFSKTKKLEIFQRNIKLNYKDAYNKMEDRLLNTKNKIEIYNILGGDNE